MTGTRAVIAAVALLLGLSACSGEDPEPKVAPPSPTSPSTTGTSAETPPEMPDAAKGTDAAAAEAFVEFYWEMVGYAQSTGNVEGLRRLATSGCEACRGGVAYLEDVFSSGGTIAGGRGTVRNASASSVQDDGATKVFVRYELFNTKQVVDLPGTSKDRTIPAGTLRMLSTLEATPDGWLMSYWGEQ